MQNFYIRYCGSYLLTYVAVTAVMIVVSIVLNVDLPSVMSIIASMVSAYYPAALFVKDYKRMPDKAEKRKFSFAAFILITVLSLIIAAGLIAISPDLGAEIKHMLTAVPTWIFVVLIAVVTMIYYFTIMIGFWMGAKMQLKALEKKAGQ